MRSFIGLIVSIVICFSAAFAGSRFMPGEWYASLVKPSWNPPNTIFAPVWTTLYLMMAFSAWIVWKSFPFAQVKSALIIFVIQLILNALWTYLFFGMKNPGLAFVEIIILWGFILLTTVLFMRLNTLAGLLLIPYFLWVSFASFLNYTIWRLNM